jgi:hypothetical protein
MFVVPLSLALTIILPDSNMLPLALPSDSAVSPSTIVFPSPLDGDPDFRQIPVNDRRSHVPEISTPLFTPTGLTHPPNGSAEDSGGLRESMGGRYG